MAGGALKEGTLAAAFNRDGSLPVFPSQASLDAEPAWRAYLQAVYGSLPQAFPASLQDFVVLYLPDLYAAGLEPPGVVRCPTEPGQLYVDMSNSHDPPSTLWVWRPPPFAALADGAWIEITHCADPVASLDEHHGSWLYSAPGSGVFYNVGKTRAFGTHAEAANFFLGAGSCEDADDECLRFFPGIMAAGLQQGLKSIQFLKHGDQRCGLMRPEIVDLAGRGVDRCAIQGLRTGWRHELPCDCARSNGSCASCRVRVLGLVPLWLVILGSLGLTGLLVLVLAVMARRRPR